MATSIPSLEKWINHTFESSSGLTQEWKNAASSMRSFFKRTAEENGFSLVSFNRSHFYASGFMKHRKSGKFVYFCTSDVRFFRWHESVLLRTAKNEKDYTGGRNNMVSIYEIPSCLNSLLLQA